MLKFKYGLEADEPTARDTTRDFTMLASTWALVYGLTLIVQDRSIWAYPAYNLASAVPGSPPTWGYILCIGGLLMFAGMHFGIRRVMSAGTWICLLWHFSFVVTLSQAVWNDDLSASPLVNYAVAFVAYGLLVITYRGKNAVRNAPQAGD